MKVAAIQMAPVILDSRATWEKLKKHIAIAAADGAKVACWGETLLPGYPQWLSPTGGASFDDPDQKRAYQLYVEQALPLDGEIVEEMKEAARQHGVWLVGGIAERYSGSTYATIVTIDDTGSLLGRHRKLKPTYEERLVWADGDGKGLNVYDSPVGKLGSLNCWENWLPLARAALHRQEEMVHIAVWPGSDGLTRDISRFYALEGRSWVVSVSGLLRGSDFGHLDGNKFPQKAVMAEENKVWQDGGSVIVDPCGNVVAGPLIGKEGILYADIDLGMVLRERHNLDISGHYSRFDIFDFSIRK